MNEVLADRMTAPMIAGSEATRSTAPMRSAMKSGETTFTLRAGASRVIRAMPAGSSSKRNVLVISDPFYQCGGSQAVARTECHERRVEIAPFQLVEDGS